MIAIIDYEMGNLRSVQKAIESVGGEALITQNPEIIQKSEKILLPGVGAIKPAMDRLDELNLIPSICAAAKAKKPFLGICLGYQLLFESSDEGGNTKGLGLLKGSVVKFTDLKIPHMGWNQLIKKTPSPLFNDIEDGANVYFCHSYYVKPADTDIVSTQTEYGVNFASSVISENIMGVQFHPEKSQSIGLQMLRNFLKL